MPTADGGQFALDWVITTGPDDLDKPIVMVVPGITGKYYSCRKNNCQDI